MLDYGVSVLEVVTINLVLSGDNALVLALVAQKLPATQRRGALLVGGASAVLLQLFFTLTVSYLLLVPGLRLVGAFLAAGVACRLVRDEGREVADAPPPGSFRAAVVRIALVNVVMSLDNVIAVASVSRSDPIRISLGLFVSALVILAFSSLVLRVIGRFRWIAYAGAGVLALTAAGMMWQDLGAVVSSAHLPLTTAAAGLSTAREVRWGFKVIVVSTCLTAPRWWPRGASLGSFAEGH